MDPDALLASLRDQAQHIVDEDERGRPVSDHHAVEVAAGVLDLLRWIERGGALPTAWRR